MKNVLVLALLIIVALHPLSYSGPGRPGKDKRPNFVFILTDDQPYDYLGCTGNPIVQTPHLDRLASEGILFTNAHITSALCTPSRVSIFLSQFERKHGVNFNSGTSISMEAWEESYPVVMRKSGYYTGYVGKNHAPVGDGGYSSGVIERSFDYWYASHNHLSFYPKSKHPIFSAAQADTQVEIIGEGIDAFLGNDQQLEDALRFLEKRPEGKPFCLSISFNLPHNASTKGMEKRAGDPEIYKSLYRDMQIPLPANYVAKADVKVPKLPPSLLRAKDRQPSYDYVNTPESLRERYIRHMQAMTGIDKLIGALREKLRRMQLDENTIIIFTSDHGILNGQYGLGGKALCYEYATHVPLIIYNPLVPVKARGKRVSELVQSIDVAPTMLLLAGIPVPSGMQGQDLSGILRGEIAPVRSYLYTENLWSTVFGNPRCEAVQDKQWKYIRYYENNTLSATRSIGVAKQLGIDQGKVLNTSSHDADIVLYRDYAESPLEGETAVFEELFNLAKDPHEASNVAGNEEYKAVLEKMREVWKEQITIARGTEAPKVLRYTAESQDER